MSQLTLRPYQEQIVDTIEGMIAFGSEDITIQAQTGAGKAIAIAAICERFKDRNIIIMVAMEPLVQQLSESLSMLNVDHSIVKAGRDKDFDNNKNIHIVMAQTLYARIDKMHLHCDILIIDEYHVSHQYSSKRTQTLLEKLKPDNIIGVTATPFTGSNFKLPDTEIVQMIDIRTLIDNGYLAPMKYYIPHWAEQIDYSLLKKSGGEFNQEELNQIIANEQNIQNTIKSMNQMNAKNKKTIVFTTTTEMADLLTQRLRTNGYNAFSYHAKLNKKDDENIITAFKNNTLFHGYQADINDQTLFKQDVEPEPVKCIVSVAKLIAGFDVQDIDLGVLSFSTLRINKFLQSSGRVMRAYKSLSLALNQTEPGQKTAFVVSYYNELEKIKEQLISHSRTDIDVFKYDSEPKGYDNIIYNIRPDKECGQILDLGSNIARFGFPEEPYNAPEYTDDKQLNKERLDHAMRLRSLEHLSVLIEDKEPVEMSRQIYLQELTKIEQNKNKLTNMSKSDLYKKMYISDDPAMIIAITAVLFDKEHSTNEIKDKWGKPARGYISNKDKSVVNFMNPNSIAWVSEPWQKALEKETEFYRNKYIKSLKTRCKNAINNKESFWALRYFIDWLLEKDEIEKAEQNFPQGEPEQNDYTKSLGYEIVIEENDIPF